MSKEAADLTRLPPRALRVVAKVIETGDQKYEERDWISKDARNDARAALGHLNQWISGVDFDEESDLSPLAHAAARLLFLIEREELSIPIGEWRRHVDAAQNTEGAK